MFQTGRPVKLVLSNLIIMRLIAQHCVRSPLEKAPQVVVGGRWVTSESSNATQGLAFLAWAMAQIIDEKQARQTLEKWRASGLGPRCGPVHADVGPEVALARALSPQRRGQTPGEGLLSPARAHRGRRRADASRIRRTGSTSTRRASSRAVACYLFIPHQPVRSHPERWAAAETSIELLDPSRSCFFEDRLSPSTLTRHGQRARRHSSILDLARVQRL